MGGGKQQKSNLEVGGKEVRIIYIKLADKSYTIFRCSLPTSSTHTEKEGMAYEAVMLGGKHHSYWRQAFGSIWWAEVEDEEDAEDDEHDVDVPSP